MRNKLLFLGKKDSLRIPQSVRQSWNPAITVVFENHDLSWQKYIWGTYHVAIHLCTWCTIWQVYKTIYHEHDANQDISLSYLNLSRSISICSRLNNCGCRKIHKLAIFQLDHSTWVGRPLIKKIHLRFLIFWAVATSVLVSYPTRWSFSFILGPLHWSSNIQGQIKRNIVQLCTTSVPTSKSIHPNR